MEYRLVKIDNTRLTRDFIHLPWKIYANNPYWVPPLLTAEKERLNHRKNSFFKYGSLSLFGALDENRMLAGRIASVYNPRHNEVWNRKDGFFGLFECIENSTVAEMLINAVKEELKSHGVDTLIGPVTLTTNEETGLLIDGFDSSPTFMTNYSQPYYQTLIERLGFSKVQDLLTYQWTPEHVFPDRFYRLVWMVSSNKDIHLQKIDPKNFEPEIRKIKHIYNNSFKGIWGFVPLDDNEVKEMGISFTQFADFDLIYFAYYKNQPVGFCLALPDINVAIKKVNGRLFPLGFFTLLREKKRIHSIRLNVIAVLPEHRVKGIAALLIDNMIKKTIEGGYQAAELSVIMESNHTIISIIEALGFKKAKRYRVYQATI